MGSVGIRWLRIWILFPAIVSLVWSSICYNQPLASYNDYSGSYCYTNSMMYADYNKWLYNARWIPIALAAVIILSYAYSLKGKPVVQRSVRAFFMCVLFGLSVFNTILYSYIRIGTDYSGYPLLAAGIFIFVEMVWTLWDTRPKQPNKGQEYKENPNVIIVSPEMPNGDNTLVSSIQYVYPAPLPQPQAVTPDTHFITVEPLPPNVKSSPQSQSEMALAHLPQNQEIPQPSQPSQLTTLASPLAPQLLPQAPQFYETPQLPPQAPQFYETPQLSPQAPQFYGTPQLLPQAPQFYGTSQQGVEQNQSSFSM